VKLLAIDTTDWKCSVALWEGGRELSFEEKAFERDQAAYLPHLVQAVMGTHSIDQVLVNIGPGSFTGIRVGLAFAKGLSLGWNVPLKGMDSFTATYTCMESVEDLLVLIEARRSDVFAQRFLKGVPQEPRSLTRQEIEAILAEPTPPLLAGSGVHGLGFDEITVTWQGAQKLAYAFFKNPQLVVEPLPFYVREADVTQPCA
jgi:tRNA threonylcarbamoyl adenosine modification protein YeaZ